MTSTRAGVRVSLSFAFAFAVTTVGCAMEKSAPPASAPSAERVGAAPAQAYGQPGYPSAPASVPGQPSPYAQPPPPPPQPGTPVAPGAPAGGAAGGATARAMALQNASSEIESSQRELDVSAGDCRNACRALGSMDRAAGKVCELAQGEGEGHRCDSAKQRVYSARDRVRTTCGSCPGGPSVERGAPIPSLR